MYTAGSQLQAAYKRQWDRGSRLEASDGRKKGSRLCSEDSRQQTLGSHFRYQLSGTRWQVSGSRKQTAR